MGIGDLLNRINWLIRLVSGEYAKVIAVFAAWQLGLPVNILVQIRQAKFQFTAQESPKAGIRRRLIIEELE